MKKKSETSPIPSRTNDWRLIDSISLYGFNEWQIYSSQYSSVERVKQGQVQGHLIYSWGQTQEKRFFTLLIKTCLFSDYEKNVQIKLIMTRTGIKLLKWLQFQIFADSISSPPVKIKRPSFVFDVYSNWKYPGWSLAASNSQRVWLGQSKDNLRTTPGYYLGIWNRFSWTHSIINRLIVDRYPTVLYQHHQFHVVHIMILLFKWFMLWTVILGWVLLVKKWRDMPRVSESFVFVSHIRHQYRCTLNSSYYEDEYWC